MRLIMILSLFIVPDISFADFSEPSLEDWAELDQLKQLAIYLMVIQFIVLVFRGPFGRLLGIHKFLVISALSVVVTLVSEWLRSGSLLTVATSAPSLMAIQVFLNQAMKQWEKRHEETNLARNEIPIPGNRVEHSDFCSEHDPRMSNKKDPS